MTKCEHLCGWPFNSKCGAPIDSAALWGVGNIPLKPELLPSQAILAPPSLTSLTLENGGLVSCRAAFSEDVQSQCTQYIPESSAGTGE